MRTITNYFPVYIFIGFMIFSCDSMEDPQSRLLPDSVGFEGVLPDGSDFGNVDIRSSNGLTTSGINRVYTGRHFLSIRNIDTGWSLDLETPGVLFTKEIPAEALQENDGSALKNYFTENYSYALLLEKLKDEEQKALADADYNGIENFRISLTQQNEYFAYLQNTSNPKESGSVRVLKVETGLVQNTQGQDVRKIEVVLELDLLLTASESSISPQIGSLKGLARLRYREDFYQGEIED
ncbi:hypothetical protein [Algoriphagus sp.]|uniref:hypothetical protein n=1 Tax=Algoriphagus sp. TaxID=1872435 RepID=UPI0032962091